LSVVALVVLVLKAVRYGTVWEIFGTSIFGASLILLYSVSCLYHGARNPSAKRVLRMLDHGCIFILIAGSYTPFVLGPLRGALGWWLFGIIWTLAIAGFAMKIVFHPRFAKPMPLFYLLMGWLIVVAASQIWDRLPVAGVLWLVIGGLAYSLGVIFFVMDPMKFAHTIWHFFVMGGSAAHFLAVFYGVLIVAK